MLNSLSFKAIVLSSKKLNNIRHVHFQQNRPIGSIDLSLEAPEDVVKADTKLGNMPSLKPSVSSSTTTSGGTTGTEMMERRDEPLADLAPTSKAINEGKQKRAPVSGVIGGVKGGPGEVSAMRRRKLGTGTTIQPEMECGVAVPKAVPSTSNGSGPGTAERRGGKGK